MDALLRRDRSGGELAEKSITTISLVLRYSPIGRSGKRASFDVAASPEQARAPYELFVEQIRQHVRAIPNPREW